MDAMRAGGAMPTVLNAANEVAVAEFLAGRLTFPGISKLVEDVCNAMARSGEARLLTNINEALGVDHIARERTRTILAQATGSR